MRFIFKVQYRFIFVWAETLDTLVIYISDEILNFIKKAPKFNVLAKVKKNNEGYPERSLMLHASLMNQSSFSVLSVNQMFTTLWLEE